MVGPKPDAEREAHVPRVDVMPELLAAITDAVDALKKHFGIHHLGSQQTN